ncbi:MAG TPA: hypothetical protein VEC01_18065 [Noviherbaspirillum sp.]|uniref:hypothetical protein n=1 Tax=Noviherbaspirillum sp. TaxID=1926288 RepID=UPI002D580940|nr:hypothetical protein [Noviherbaspirillum sp.]HYD97236.1 hypothetical protein [Noviherbaspirillum sp.]
MNDDQHAVTRRDTSGQHPISATAPRSDYEHIQGWGADLDHKNRPAYPMERTPPRLEGLHWERPEDQPLNMKIYYSTERPGVTPVFGTSTPPSGLSGKIRDIAYKLSENDIRHWLLLLFADRVNVVEGIADDLMRGHIPNVLAEMGAGAEFKHNRAGFVRKAVIASAIVGAGYYLYRRKARRSAKY